MDSSSSKNNRKSSKLGGLVTAFTGRLADFSAKFFGLSRNNNIDPRFKGGDMADYDRKLVFSLSKSKVPSLRQISFLSMFLSKRERFALRLSLIVLLGSLIFTGVRFYQKHVQIAPIQGGEYIEGLVGAPKYINPLYATVNDVDSDITRLIFSSLFKRDKNGTLTNDLVEKIEIAPDGKTYSFEIRGDVVWHNNSKLTADDIVFTFRAIQDSEYNSPLKNVFAGVTVEKTGDNSITFRLPEPYAGFMQLLTFGIINQNIWGEIPPNSAPLAELNLKPIGSGPYRFKSFTKDKSGKLKSYNITLNENYYGQKPYIEDITFIFLPNVEEAIAALNDNTVSGISYLPVAQKSSLIAQDSLNFHKLTIPQITAVFFNAGKNPLISEKKARQALAFAIDKQGLINDLGAEYYLPANTPFESGSFWEKGDVKRYDYNKDEALKLLKELGWEMAEITQEDVENAQQTIESDASEEEKSAAQRLIDQGPGNWLQKDGNYFIVRLTTVDHPENSKVADKISQYWQEIGVKTQIDLVNVAQIQSNVIKTRDFEALFYGLGLGADPDPYTFWHSSQIEKGLNLAGYSDKDIDKILEEARQATDQNKRIELYNSFQDAIAEELPAIFLYQNTYLYVQSKSIKGYQSAKLYAPSDRFSDISDWYIKTGKTFKW